LGFVPVCRERYYLACRVAEVESPALRELIALLRSEKFREHVATLPGYSAPQAGEIHSELQAGSSVRS
jgi:molybdate-binding protein